MADGGEHGRVGVVTPELQLVRAHARPAQMARLTAPAVRVLAPTAHEHAATAGPHSPRPDSRYFAGAPEAGRPGARPGRMVAS